MPKTFEPQPCPNCGGFHPPGACQKETVLEKPEKELTDEEKQEKKVEAIEVEIHDCLLAKIAKALEEKLGQDKINQLTLLAIEEGVIRDGSQQNKELLFKVLAEESVFEAATIQKFLPGEVLSDWMRTELGLGKPKEMKPMEEYLDTQLVNAYFDRKTGQLLKEDKEFKEKYGEYLKENLTLKLLEGQAESASAERIEKIEYLLNNFDQEVKPYIQNIWSSEAYIKLVQTESSKSLKTILKRAAIATAGLIIVAGVVLPKEHSLPDLDTQLKLVDNFIDGMASLDTAALLNGVKKVMIPEVYAEEPFLNLNKIIKNPEQYSLEILKFAELIKEKMPEKAKSLIKKAAEEYPLSALKYSNHYKDQPWAGEVIKKAAEKAAEKDPLSALKYSNHYKDQPWAGEVIVFAAKLSPAAAISFYPQIKEIVEKSNVNIIKKIKEITQTKLSPPAAQQMRKMAVLLDKLIEDRLSLEEAEKIVKDPEKFFQALVEIKARPEHLGGYDVETELFNIAVRKVYEINRLHNEPDRIRFASVENADPNELYALIVYGEQEIFTSSFNGLFNRLLERMNKTGLSGDRLLQDLGMNKFRTFVKLSVGFNRINEFLKTMSPQAKEELLGKFILEIEKEKEPLKEAVTVADAFISIKDAETLTFLQTKIKEEYERVTKEKHQEGQALYGLLSGMFAKKAIINKEWIKEMSEKYRLPNFDRLPSSELFNKDAANIQQHFFYNDEDGRVSFQSFFSHYQDKPGWKIKEKDNYILISSVGKDKKIEIYANRPEKEDEGVDEIGKLLKERNIQTIVVVHRGHSFHAPKTIERIPSIARIVSLGSCGGYFNIARILEKAPQAHVIATKGKGTYIVNNPLLEMLNEEILSGKDIDWWQFWARAEKSLGHHEDFKNYVPPHKNLGIMFMKAYRSLLEKQE